MSRTEEERLRPLWTKLAKKIGAQTLPESVEELLLQNHETEVNLAIGTDDPDDLEPLIRVASSLYTMQFKAGGSNRRRRKQSTGEDNQIVTPEVGQYERLRAEVLSDYLAKMVAIDPEVVRFRQRVLGGELLSPKQARTFLSSPATRFLSQAAWRAHEIPAIHTSTLLDENYGRTEDGPFHWVQVRTDPPGEIHAVFVPHPESYDNLTYLAEDGRPKQIAFWPGSVLGDLRKISKELTKCHPWDIDAATWFALTGEYPVVRPIEAKVNSSWTVGTRAHTTISLTVQPWVPPETVEGAYRQLQKKVIGGECGRISDKNLRLLQFVTKRADANGNLPKGDVLVQEWDRKWKRKHSEWCYGDDKRRFWRDFRHVQRKVANSKRAGLFLEAGAYTPEEYVPQI
jgi:hypothetical protein